MLLQNYYAIGHDSLDNYIAQVSGQAPTEDTQADCADNGFAFANVVPGTPDPDQAFNPGQVDGQGCVYPASVQTIANQLDAKYPPNKTTHVASWRAYDQDMGNTPSRDGGVTDPSGGTDCGHPAIGATDTAEVATATDQYTTRHNPFVWFHSIIDNTAECDANVVPLGTLGANAPQQPPGQGSQEREDDARASPSSRPTCAATATTPTCAGTNSTGGHAGGLAGADQFLQTWMPLILGSPAYKSGDTLVVITFDEADVDRATPRTPPPAATRPPGPTRTLRAMPALSTDTAPGGGQVGALLLDAKYIAPGTTDTTGHLQPLLGPAQLRGPARA